MGAEQVVQEFCDAMVVRNAEGLRSFLADSVVYQNVGMPASVGVDAVVANLGGQFAAFPDSYEYKTLNIATNGNVVLTERLDMVKGPDGRGHAVPVMGAFEVEGDKIMRWTDYWDLGLPGKMMSGEDYSALVP